MLSKFAARFKPDKYFYVESSNVTCLETHINMLAERTAGLQFLQEHSMPKSKHGWAKAVFKDHRKKSISAI